MFESGETNPKWCTSAPGGYITPAAWGSTRLQSRGGKQKWPTSGPRGYITLSAWGDLNAAEQGKESQVSHKWAG